MVLLLIMSMCGVLVWAAFRTLDVSFDGSEFEFCYRLFGVSFLRRHLKLNEIYIVGQVVGNRYRERLLAVYGGVGRRKLFLANEHSCCDIAGLYDWMVKVSSIEAKDFRHRITAG